MPCLCLCLGFLELHSGIRSRSPSRELYNTSSTNIPNDVDSVFPANGLIQRQQVSLSPYLCVSACLCVHASCMHTLQPSHSLLTEDRVFIPRACSKSPVADSVVAACNGDAARKTPKPPFWMVLETWTSGLENCENVLETCTSGRKPTEHIVWRRRPGEAPSTDRRGCIVFSRAAATRRRDAGTRPRSRDERDRTFGIAGFRELT